MAAKAKRVRSRQESKPTLSPTEEAKIDEPRAIDERNAPASSPDFVDKCMDFLFLVCVTVPVAPLALSLLYMQSAINGTFVYDDCKFFM